MLTTKQEPGSQNTNRDLLMDNQYGKVIWLTGLSSSGKSTLAKKIQ